MCTGENEARVCKCAVFLYITACLQVLIVRSVKDSLTVCLNDDVMHAHLHK